MDTRNVFFYIYSVAQRSHSYFSRLPALSCKLRILLLFPLKVDPLNLESQNQAKNIFLGFKSIPHLNLRQSGPEVPEL